MIEFDRTIDIGEFDLVKEFGEGSEDMRGDENTRVVSEKYRKLCFTYPCLLYIPAYTKTCLLNTTHLNFR